MTDPLQRLNSLIPDDVRDTILAWPDRLREVVRNLEGEPAGPETAAILAELRGEAAVLLPAAPDDDQSDRSVVIAALRVLGDVEKVIVRELGHGWRRVVRPNGPLTGWGDRAGQPLTLADAVEYLAVDRAQWQREADSSRAAAGEAVEQARAVATAARGAFTQVREIRRELDDALRPNATAIYYCDECEGDTPRGRCEIHEDVEPEPPLSDDLAVEVHRLVTRWRESESARASALRARVSVYADGHLVTGPAVVPAAAADLNPQPPDAPAWPESPQAREAVHHLSAVPAAATFTACGLPAVNGSDYRTTPRLADTTCPRCVDAVADPDRHVHWLALNDPAPYGSTGCGLVAREGMSWTSEPDRVAAGEVTCPACLAVLPRRPRRWVAVGSLADYDEALADLGRDYEVRVERGIPSRVRDLRAGPPPGHVEAAVYCDAQFTTVGDPDRPVACLLLYAHKGAHVSRDDQGRYRAFSVQALAFAPLGTGQWVDHARLRYGDEQYVVLRSMFGYPDGRRALLYADGSRRTVQLDPPEPPGPGEVVKL